jgi:hypothetical protein
LPIFTKRGCNAGACHGKAGGQNGFRLSLLGFEPTLDHETLVKEGRGRRLFPASPDRSLLLQKAVARVPHGGGKRLDPDSSEYRLIRRWIGLGMPVGRPTDPTVASIEVYPRRRIMKRGATHQLAVKARYTDGSSEDVTRWAQFQTNDPEVASAEHPVPGRDHWGNVMSVPAAGGGFARGRVVGASNSRGESPRTDLSGPRTCW